MTTSQDTWTPNQEQTSALYGFLVDSMNLLSAIDNAATVVAQHRALHGAGGPSDLQRLVEALRQVAQEGALVVGVEAYGIYVNEFFVKPTQTEENNA